MAASVSEDASVFTFWPDRKQPRPGLRPARGIAMRQTTIRPFKIVKDWSSPASSQHDDDDDDKQEPDIQVSSKVSQSPSIQGSPASVARTSPQPGSLPEPEEPTLTDIHGLASVPDADPSQRRKSGRAPKARQEWWKASPDVGSNSNAVRSTGRKRQERSSSLLPDDSDSASVTTTRKKNRQSNQPEESDSSAVQNTGKKRRQRSSSFPPDDSDTASATTTRKKKQHNIEPAVSNSSTVRKTGKKRQQKSSSLLPDDSNSEPAMTTRKKKQQSIEPAVSESDSSVVQTTGKKKRQRRQSFLPDESDSSSVETTEKKRGEKGSSQAVDLDSRSVRKRRQHSIEPEDSDSSSVRTTNKKRQRQQSFQSDESDFGAARTTGKKKRQQTQQSSLPSKNKAEKTRPSSQRTPLLVPDVHAEESTVSSESSMRRTRRVSKPSTEWWKVTEINGSDSRNRVSSSSDENQPVPRGFETGESSGSSSSSGGYRGMKTPRSQGQGGANNLVSGVSRRVISKRPPIPPRHAGTGNRTKGQTVYQWNAGGLERNLGDLSDLDIMLTMIEDLTQQYQDSCGNLTESAVCQEMMTQFRDKVIGAIQRKIDLVHKYKFDQSRLRRMDLTIKQRRSELLSLQREDVRLDHQLDQLQRKLTGSTERDQILQKTSTVLQDLQELQQKYMDSAK